MSKSLDAYGLSDSERIKNYNKEIYEKIYDKEGFIKIYVIYCADSLSDTSHYSTIFGKFVSAEKWINRYILPPQYGNIYMQLEDGRTIPVYDQKELDNYYRVLSKEVWEELDKYAYKNKPEDYIYRTSVDFYFKYSDSDIHNFYFEMERDKKRREQDKQKYEELLRSKELYKKLETEKKKKAEDELAEKRDNLDRMFGK